MYRDTEPKPWRLAVYYAVPEEEDDEDTVHEDDAGLLAKQIPKTLPDFESAG